VWLQSLQPWVGRSSHTYPPFVLPAHPYIWLLPVQERAEASHAHVVFSLFFPTS